jgi:hypothetical protein
MDYEYRNIDTDIELLKAARMYWEEGVTKQDVYDTLANKCYTPWEADRAMSDYYYIYIKSPNTLKYLIIFACVNIIFLVSCYWIGVWFK